MSGVRRESSMCRWVCLRRAPSSAEIAGVALNSDRTSRYDHELVKAILVPFNYGLGAARHIAWYVSYQVTGAARDS